MSRHEGVSCDSCLKSNFSGRRYKCLICYDYDLCADCYEENATSTRHSADHPMQCILTRSDIELYYGGEMLNSEQPQSFTCPYCKKMGFSDSTLLDHVGSEHTDTGLEVVCPVCAGLPGGDPNLVTDDFAGHLALEHRPGPRDLISFLDEPSAIRHGGVRRIPGRALGGPRSRRSNMHFSSSGGLSALSPSGREAVDPIAELLSQLSGGRRGAPQPSQLQQLQMHIQLERQQLSSTRQQLERFPRRQPHPTSSSNTNASVQEVIASGSTGNMNNVGSSATSGIITSTPQPQPSMAVSSITARELILNSSSPLPLAMTSVGPTGVQPNNASDIHSQYLLSKFMQPTLSENELAQLERDRADRSQYVQALVLSTLSRINLIDENERQKRAESQETNSDNINSDANNGSGEHSLNNSKEDKIVKNGTDKLGNGGSPGQVHHSQLTSHSLQNEIVELQNYRGSVCKKKVASAIADNSAIVIECRERPPPSPGGIQEQGQGKPTREIKITSVTSKEIPDSR